ncbi:MAG: hypothetical protein VKJ04_06895 [Vampirovibrionales bacterium]|nr:hypothetical protein [Vampirovibrionales bacterium]
MPAIETAVRSAAHVPKSIARHAGLEELFKVHEVLAPHMPSNFTDAFNKLSTDNTFFIKAPQIPVIRHIVLWFKNLRLERFAKREKLGHIAVIRQYGEKLSDRMAKLWERLSTHMKENDPQAHASFQKMGVLQRYDKDHVVFFTAVRK